MKKKIHLAEQEVEYSIRKNRRARRVRLTVNCDATVVLTVPHFVRTREAEQFIMKKAHWLIERIKYFKSHPSQWCCKGSRAQYEAHKETARALLTKKVAELNAFYNFPFKRISVKNQKSRWGSCSKLGNINFNYKLVFLDERLVDYVVAHELCHLAELNHSTAFWKLVERAIPDYRERRAELMKKRF